MSSSQVLDPTVLSTEEKPLVIRQEGRKEIDVVAHIDATNERLARIEEQLDILTLEPVFEEEFEELREAKKAYDEVLDRLRTFNALRGSR